MFHARSREVPAPRIPVLASAVLAAVVMQGGAARADESAHPESEVQGLPAAHHIEPSHHGHGTETAAHPGHGEHAEHGVPQLLGGEFRLYSDLDYPVSAEGDLYLFPRRNGHGLALTVGAQLVAPERDVPQETSRTWGLRFRVGYHLEHHASHTEFTALLGLDTRALQSEDAHGLIPNAGIHLTWNWAVAPIVIMDLYWRPHALGNEFKDTISLEAGAGLMGRLWRRGEHNVRLGCVFVGAATDLTRQDPDRQPWLFTPMALFSAQ